MSSVDCNKCAYINFTEADEKEYARFYGFWPHPHKCKKYDNWTINHVAGSGTKIKPCYKCKNDNYMNYMTKEEEKEMQTWKDKFYSSIDLIKDQVKELEQFRTKASELLESDFIMNVDSSSGLKKDIETATIKINTLLEIQLKMEDKWDH
jgi:hypothetical protein